MSYDFIPEGGGKAIHKECVYEREQYPEDVTEKDIELDAAPATRAHMQQLSRQRSSRAAGPWPTSKRDTSRPPRASWRTSRCSSAAAR